MKTLLILLFYIPAYMLCGQNIIWVSPDGSGSGTSRNNPVSFNTLNISQIPVGSILKLKKGVYILSGNLVFSRNVTIEGSYTFETDETRDSIPTTVFNGNNSGIIFRAQNQENIRNYIIHGISFENINRAQSIISTADINGGVFSLGTVNLSIVNCSFFNCSSNASLISGSNQLNRITINIDSSYFLQNRSSSFATVFGMPNGPTCQAKISNSTFENNSFTGVEGGLFTIKNPRDTVEIFNCKFIDNNISNGNAGCVYIDQSVSDIQIENCLFKNLQFQISGRALYFNGLRSQSGNIGLRFYNNLFKGFRSSSSLVYLNSASLSSFDITVANTEISGNRCGDGGFLNIHHDPNTFYNLIFINNTIASNSFTNGFIDFTFTSANSQGRISAPNSIYFNNNTPFSHHRGGAFNGPSPDLSRAFISAPSFLDQRPLTDAPTDQGNYRLSLGSLAIDSGFNHLYLSPPLPAVDLDNRARFQGSRIDFGAYEFGAGSVPVLRCRLDTLEVLSGVDVLANTMVINQNDFDSVRISSAGILFEQISFAQTGLFELQVIGFINNILSSTCTAFIKVGDIHSPIICLEDTIIRKQGDILQASDCVVNPGQAILALRLKNIGNFSSQVTLNMSGTFVYEVQILYAFPSNRIDTCEVLVRVDSLPTNDVQRLFCKSGPISLLKLTGIQKEQLIDGTLLNGDILTLIVDGVQLDSIIWNCEIQNSFTVTLLVRQVGGFQTLCDIKINPEEITAGIQLSELFFDQIDSSCALPFRYFFVNAIIPDDSINYINTNVRTETPLLNPGTIIRVAPSGLDSYLRIQTVVEGCVFRDSVLVRGRVAPVNNNLNIDLYEIKLQGDPSKYLARLRGTNLGNWVRWGYVDRSDFSLVPLSGFNSLHYTLLESLADTTKFLFFADVASTMDTTCYIRYFRSHRGSIFNYRSLVEERPNEAEPSLVIYPNPGIGKVNISYTGPHYKKIRIKIYSAIGQVIESYEFDNVFPNSDFTIEPIHLSPGMYHLEFIDIENSIQIIKKYIRL